MTTAGFYIPPKSEVGYLDPDIANEGMRAIDIPDLESGVNWQPPPQKLCIPDLSQVKRLAKYFGRTNFPIYPAWFYHPTDEPRLLRNAQDAETMGIRYRKATPDESMRYGLKNVWDWDAGCLWRPVPYDKPTRLDRRNLPAGKELVYERVDSTVQQHELVKALIPEVAAAVAKAMQGKGGPSTPASVNPKEWAEFQEFMAWKKSAEVVTALAEDADADNDDVPAMKLNAFAQPISEAEEKALWVKEAESRGIEIDKRWSASRIKDAIEKAA